MSITGTALKQSETDLFNTILWQKDSIRTIETLPNAINLLPNTTDKEHNIRVTVSSKSLGKKVSVEMNNCDSRGGITGYLTKGYNFKVLEGVI